MTSALALEQSLESRSELLKQLRKQMAAVPSRVGSSRRGQLPADIALPVGESLLPIPDLVADLLPAGLPKGAVGVVTGARSLSLSMAAAVTAAGGFVAIVGQPDAGLLAAAEMGADLDRLAVIPDPGADPVEVAAVLMDGMDLVVLGLRGRAVPPSRARAVTARARHKGCTLLIADGDWPGAAVRLDARVCGYEMAGDRRPGFGRISQVRLSTRARARTG
ncbi:MAG TPA: hypothetical protein VFW21_13015 [Mycobacterium sp.]|nr:hypothetical protein [Mycobacterium sp.]